LQKVATYQAASGVESRILSLSAFISLQNSLIAGNLTEPGSHETAYTASLASNVLILKMRGATPALNPCFNPCRVYACISVEKAG
jgi:hypothetical protein